MSIATLKGEKCPVELWSPIHEVDSEALTQLRNVTKLPWVYHHVAAMPDVHAGKGCTVGSVIAMKDAVSPAAVGVDIGCGMAAIKTSLRASDLPEDLTKIRHQIERDIPVGFNAHKEPVLDSRRIAAFDPATLKDAVALFDEFSTLDSRVHGDKSKAQKQLGTLGGGNHFIELCLDDGTCTFCEGYGEARMLHIDPRTNQPATEACPACKGAGRVDPTVWLMLHSGSRNIGKELAEIHIGRARSLAHNQTIVDRDMAVFLAGTPEMAAYRRDLYWAQRFAFMNRRVMLALFQDALRRFFPQIGFETPILCHHNYVSEEIHFGEKVFITRKGAISAKRCEMGIIPGSMGTKSYIVRGLGNPNSFESASHGAGRKMSRGAAKRTFTLEDLEEQTKGVCCRKDAGVLDEIPGAYKSIDEVMQNQQDLVEVVATLKQVLCVKG